MSAAGNLGRHLLFGALNRDDWRALAFIAGSLVLAGTFYRTGVFAFGAVSERIVRLVDLQRLRLITGVGYAPPATVDEELQIFRELNDFFGSGNQRDLKRKLTPPPAPKAGSGGRSGASPLGSIRL